VARVAAPQRFIVGDGSFDYALPESKLGVVRHELVHFDHGQPVVSVPAAATPTHAAAPGARVALAPNETVEIKLADIALVVRASAIARPVPRSILRSLDRRLFGYWIGAAAAALLLVGMYGMPRFTLGLHGQEWSRAPGYELRPYGVEEPVPPADAYSDFGLMPVHVAWR
jgi:hypothetical protein